MAWAERPMTIAERAREVGLEVIEPCKHSRLDARMVDDRGENDHRPAMVMIVCKDCNETLNYYPLDPGDEPADGS